jgi:hypothetical protein
MKHLKTILAIWGGVSGILLIIAVSYVAYSFTAGNTVRLDSATKKDVRFVLNWCELGEQRIESVLHSYESARSFTGDHLDAYAIKVTNVSLSELEKPSHDYIKWTRGDNLNGFLKQGVELISSFADLGKLKWFPDLEELSSDKIYVNSWLIEIHSERPTAAQIIFVNPKEKIVYYASVKI